MSSSYNPNTGFRSYFISFDVGARLELMAKPGVSDQPKLQEYTRYSHIAFSIGSKESVDWLTAELIAPDLMFVYRVE